MTEDNVLQLLKSKVGLKLKDPMKEFIILDKLGEGSYGSVMHAKHCKTMTEYAIKQLTIEENLLDLLKEIEHMMDCKSEYIVGFKSCYLHKDSLWIVMECCAAGSIADLLRLCSKTLTEKQINHVVVDVLHALVDLFNQNRIHRDIKAGNILLTNQGVSKLADFGVSGLLSKEDAARHTVIGTPFWMAPEVIKQSGHNYKADVWSLGITIIEMAEGNPPLSSLHPLRAIFVIPTSNPPTLTDPSKWSLEMNSFLAQCLTKDPANRPNASELLNDPWITKYTHRQSKRSVRSNPMSSLISEANQVITLHGGRVKALQYLCGGDDSSSGSGSGTSDHGSEELDGNDTKVFNSSEYDTMLIQATTKDPSQILSLNACHGSDYAMASNNALNNAPEPSLSTTSSELASHVEQDQRSAALREAFHTVKINPSTADKTNEPKPWEITRHSPATSPMPSIETSKVEETVVIQKSPSHSKKKSKSTQEAEKKITNVQKQVFQSPLGVKSSKSKKKSSSKHH